MPSLSAHLRETDEHSRLPFHPACPVCRRDRLEGSLDGEDLVSRRTQAVIAAGLLAFSTAGVPAAVASPPDEVIEGTAEVVDEDPSVVFDPGGEELQLPDEAPGAPDTSAPSADLDEDAGPLEQEPATDVREPSLEADAQVIKPIANSAPSSKLDAAAPASEEPPAAPPIAPAESELQEPQANAGPRPEGGHRREVAAKDAVGDATQPRTEPSIAPGFAPAATAPAPAVEIAPAHEPATAAVIPAADSAHAATTVTTRVVARTNTGRAAQKDRYHVVRPGESLWSIAADLLGDRATVPRIAREVNRLWELNNEVIGTGRPDLLLAGTRLRLR